MERIRRLIDTPIIKVVTGMRRCGKSTILKMVQGELFKRGVTEKQILYINFESMSNSNITDHEKLYRYVTDAVGKSARRTYILLDEIQYVEGWEYAVTSFMIDLDCDVFITGSNAKLLSGELATHIAGRYITIEVYPLNFREYLEFDNSEDVKTSFNRFLKEGGLPGLFQMPDDQEICKQYVRDIYNTIILKDVIQRCNFRNTEMLDRIIKYIMDNIGNTFSAKNITDYVRSQGRTLSNDSVHSFLQALEDAFIIRKCSRFDIKGKAFLKTQEKYFMTDLGIRYSQIGYRDDDISGLLENIVCMELLSRNYALAIGKVGDKEIDFIAEKNGELAYIQVCYLLSDDRVIEREFSPLENINDNHPKIVLTMDDTPEHSRNGVKRINILKFLQGKDI
jgi:predicted AAA+ superfamily ATPase